jgi:hypothetical protein
MRENAELQRIFCELNRLASELASGAVKLESNTREANAAKDAKLAAWSRWADELQAEYDTQWWDKEFYQAVSFALDNRPDKEE